MKKTFSKLIGKALVALVTTLPFTGSAQITGPSSSQSPYCVPVAPGVSLTSILSANDNVNGYRMSGIPDGLGAFDNGDGTFTLLMNHEILSTLGVVRAHGSIGAFVSKWIINKQDLSVISGGDLMQSVYLWNKADNTYSYYSAANPSPLAAFGRFCSADLPQVSAFYNSATGNGTQERIFMNGEEIAEGRAVAHIVTGPNAGVSWELPWLGKFSWENSVALPYESDKTVVAGTDDASITTSNVYFYIGTKTNTGTEIDKAGLNGGKTFGVKVEGFPQERVSSSIINPPPAPGTHFDLIDLGDVSTLTGAELDALDFSMGGTYFSRCEDVAWDPSDNSNFYFNTTDQIDQVNDMIGTQVGNSRLWHLHFTDINNPELGGTIEAVLDGTEGQNMLDNLTIDRSEHIVDLEDVGNSAHNGKIWDYNISTDVLTQLAMHDPARFGDLTISATSPYTQDEETSGVIDVQAILGPGRFLLDDQAHYTTGIPVDIVEGGQLLSMYNPLSTSCNNYNAFITTPSGNSTFCRGSEVTLHASGGYGFTYQWYKSNTALVGETNSSYSPVAVGTYSVIESNGSCTWIPSTSINFISSPTATVQSLNGTDLCATPMVSLKVNGGTNTSTYAWSKDAVAISGATNKRIIVTEPGSYAVTIANSNGCSNTSEPTVVTKSCKLDDAQSMSDLSLNLYPNPSNGNFTIELNLDNDSEKSADIRVINMLGQTVYVNHINITSSKMTAEIQLNATIPAGNYLVGVTIGSTVHTGYIVYQK